MSYRRLLKTIITVLLVYHLSTALLIFSATESAMVKWLHGAGLIGYLLLVATAWLARREVMHQLNQRDQHSKTLERELATARNTDELTQLVNRSHLYQQLEFSLYQAQVQQTPFAVLLLNSDQLNTINMEFGHLVGDVVLKELADTLKGQVRGQDIIGRWGGDEFLILTTPTNDDHTVAFAEKLRLAVAQQRFTEDKLYLTVSIGCAMATEDDTVVSLIQRATDGVAQAKHSGRNCTRVGD
ncbi:diguanylate cyclase (GGDEF) domain-containing protein [Pseudidiomarina indica]|uniref:diguanylate cyclase n=1 Tax=Pseudidiomarina indica TaxID=1159017 RepID=A0A1G6CMR1_9GAMM|nr:GGDEF domain-containing protein [Pseudidiomarina indica]SDB34144.1 diguanylate cyclase (GGDEF) domain-containing protein [Pseudidiomarina indica]